MLLRHLTRIVLRPSWGRFFHDDTHLWLEQGLRVGALDAGSSGGHPAPRRPMWAARGGRVLLFDVQPGHSDNMEEHWELYHLDTRLGPEEETVWGDLDHGTDDRRGGGGP